MHCWQSLPQPFIEKMQTCIASEKLESVLTSFCTKRLLSIRVNTLKTNKRDLIQQLATEQIHTEEIPWYDSALLVPSGEKEKLTHSTLFSEGYFYIQSLSSMIPALVLNPQPHEKILDLCAAPGSKTTQMAMMMHNQGEILANDRSRARLYRLSSILTQQGVTNTKIHVSSGEIIWKKFPNYFDKTLVDAPCTMEGRFLASDRATYEDWSPKKVKLLSHMQKNLLRSAFFATKPGGTIVYSTCTLSPEENEEVIQWLYEQEKDNLSIENIRIASPVTVHSLQSWKNKQYAEQISQTVRILPTPIMEGFYVAKLRRLR